MKTDIVLFRKFPEPEGDIIALFPDMIEDKKKHLINSYQHIGQHGSASVDLITELEIPDESDYMDVLDLMIELRQIGYNI